MSQRSLKEHIRAGETLYVAPVPINASRKDLEKSLSRGPVHLFYANCQHEAYCERQLVNLCNMAEDLGVPVQLRVKHPRQAYLLGNHLDLGPLSINLPEVEDARTIKEALEAFYYPPVGRRSWGGSPRYRIGEMGDRATYAGWWNSNGVFALQLESVQAIVNAREIARPGVDWVGFGGQDLSFSIEMHSHSPFGSVPEATAYVVDQLKDLPVTVYDRCDQQEGLWIYWRTGG